MSSLPFFARPDLLSVLQPSSLERTVTNSECFYNSVLELFEDADKKEEVSNLLVWWNR